MASFGPTLFEYLDAASRASLDPDIGSDIHKLTDANGDAVAKTISGDGFSAQAFYTPEHQLIVAFAGTDFKALIAKPDQNTANQNDKALAIGQIVDDAMLYLGYEPPAFKDGLAFLQHVEDVAAGEGFSTAPGNVFVDGHSLGGAIAAYVAAQTGLPGTTFAAPGLPPGDIPSGADDSNVAAYVEYGDPIGNYGNDPNVEGSFLHNGGIFRYGVTTYIGSDPVLHPLLSAFEKSELKAAASLYDQGATDNDDRALGLAAFAAAANANHALTKYEADLHVTPTAGDSSLGITLQQLVDAFDQAGAQAASAGLSVTLDADVDFTDRNTAVVRGTASSPAGVRSVKISAMVDGADTDLGAATVSPDGSFTFTDAVGSNAQTDLTATATDGIGNSVSQTAHIILQGGQQSALYGAPPGGGGLTGPSRSAGSRVVEIGAPGQTAVSDAYDIFDNHGRSDTAFVFSPGFGLDVIRGFKAAGPGHDRLALPSSDFQTIADVLRNTGDIDGSAFITDPTTGDAIRLAGVTTAELKANRKDLILV